MLGRGRSAAVKTSKTTGQQGVDAPELHYQQRIPDTPKPTATQRERFNTHNELRQPCGGTCTVALRGGLEKAKKATLKCCFETRWTRRMMINHFVRAHKACTSSCFANTSSRVSGICGCVISR